MTESLEGLDERAQEEMGELGEDAARLTEPGAGAIGGGGLVGDDAVDADDNVLHMGNEGAEAARHSAEPTEGLDVAQPVEDDEKQRVRQDVKPVDLLLLPGRRVPADRPQAVEIRHRQRPAVRHQIQQRTKAALENPRNPQTSAVRSIARSQKNPNPNERRRGKRRKDPPPLDCEEEYK